MSFDETASAEQQDLFLQPQEPKEGRYPSGAEVCLERLAGRFIASCRAKQEKGPLPREADELSFACLLLYVEHGERLTKRSAKIVAQCRSVAAKSGTCAWLDRLPWDCCCDVGSLDSDKPGLFAVEANLTHGNSAIRDFVIEVGWFVRRFLNCESVVSSCLKNTADTILSWHKAAGLCAELAGGHDEFFALADAYEPEDFRDQYRDRLEAVREVGVDVLLAPLYRLELTARKHIESVFLSSPAMRIGK